MKFEDYKFKYYTEKEIINPVFDDNPAKNSWEEMPDVIEERLSKTIYLAETINDALGYKLQANSTWRFNDRKGHAHRDGKAIDLQAFKDKEYGLKAIDYLNKHKNLIMHNIDIKGFRIFLEQSVDRNGNINPFHWIHADTNYDIKLNEVKFMIGYYDKKQKEMVYIPFEGKLPIEYMK